MSVERFGSFGKQPLDIGLLGQVRLHGDCLAAGFRGRIVWIRGGRTLNRFGNSSVGGWIDSYNQFLTVFAFGHDRNGRCCLQVTPIGSHNPWLRGRRLFALTVVVAAAAGFIIRIVVSNQVHIL